MYQKISHHWQGKIVSVSLHSKYSSIQFSWTSSLLTILCHRVHQYPSSYVTSPAILKYPSFKRCSIFLNLFWGVHTSHPSITDNWHIRVKYIGIPYLGTNDDSWTTWPHGILWFPLRALMFVCVNHYKTSFLVCILVLNYRL